MKENLRKPILFLIIVVVGSVLVLFDFPLTALLPLLIVIGFATLLALGSITIPEIRGGIASLGKSGILKRLNDIKIFEKTPAGAQAAAAKPVPAHAPIKKEEPKKKGSEEKPGLASHISTLFSSIRSVGSILQQKGKREKNVEEIDKILDRTVTEKVSAPPPAAAAPATPAKAGGAGGAQLDMDDPFMSLSADEFDAGLLDGLGDDEAQVQASPAPSAPVPDTGGLLPVSPAEGPDLLAPELDVDSAASDILKQAGEGAGGTSDEFSGLDSGSLSDEDFGDLDNLNLDDVSLDADLEGGDAVPAPSSAPAAPVPQAPAAAPGSDSNAVKTAWIPSDAPKDAGEVEDEVSTQADMAAFASGAGGDEDLLSSLAADVKHVKKEQDLSLLRELKDFRAPATEIEKELSGMYERMGAGKPSRKKEPPATKGIK
ncbi:MULTISPECIES: hypothetical protein [unclassified Methanoregula]|uniref:hypothetical protein n=1 Tax=unclassified Methanoregula TaxID=2649730 RepID=UPI0009D3C6C9|nr:MULTISPECIES: hypothetical protein [unclassified Methanoregula]OPX64511.1 MAG: hypothetical protein A4E33_00861 [Methanoregula sp. PtaB.Bin085]OPY37302.1 MAG: hypothetical protein A4E34_00096 [Methanoregula sp. PtaU1.Bin006]